MTQRKQFVNPPPIFKPPTVFSNYNYLHCRFSVKEIKRVVAWCHKEYWDSLNYWSSVGNFKNVKFETEEFSTIRLMAILTAFDDICRLVKTFPDVWNALDNTTRKFLSSAYEFKSLMSR